MHKAGRILLAVTAIFAVFTCVCYVQRVLPKATLIPVADHAPIQGQSQRININTASAQQLQTLPGIGPGLSDAIIRYREENGPFQKVGDLMLVPGIGQGRMEKILDQITVGG